MSRRKNPVKRPPTYVQRLEERLDALQEELLAVVETSTIRNIDPNRNSGGGMVFIGYAEGGWGPSEPEHEAARMAALRSLRELEPVIRLPFPPPVARVGKALDRFFKLFSGWLLRKKSDRSVP